jgi:hypothetical protein
MTNPLLNRPRPLHAWLGALAFALALAACGGGGGGGTPATVGGGGGDTTNPGGVTPVTILDSFNNVVAAGGADGVGTGDSGTDGTAGEGAPIAGRVVVITDTTGKSVSATTDAQGYYRAKVTGFVPPLVAKVTRADGSTFFSLNTKALKVNGFITLNLTGLTDKVASDVARAGGKTRASDLTPQIVAANPDAIAQSINNLRTTIAPVITASGIDSASFDPLGAPFRPNHTGYDFVLDNTKVTVAADGSTVVGVSPTFTGANGLSGNWEQRMMIEGQDILVGTFPGASVPTSDSLANATAATAYSYVAPTNVSANGSVYTVTSNGNTTTITGPNTSFTLTINSYSFTNYVGCGACGVNSTVSAVMNVNFTSGGTLDGQVFPTSTTGYSATLTWKRVS